MDNTVTSKLERLFLRMQCVMSDSSNVDSSAEEKDLFTQICKLVLHGNVLRELWDEPILSRLIWLFQKKTPDLTVFGEQIRELKQRAQQVQQINDFFFAICAVFIHLLPRRTEHPWLERVVEKMMIIVNV